MKLLYSCLKQYVDLPAELSLEQLAQDLTLRTVEVEHVTRLAEGLENVVLGQIQTIQDHPKADRLRICQVDVGEEAPIQIVCGGSNLYPGQWVAVARVGALVRWHGEGEPVEIRRSKLRGESSEGMICAADELQLGLLFPKQSEAEILDLGSLAEQEGVGQLAAGEPLASFLGLDDAVIEIDNKSMTHRPDLWGHYGMARELAAIYGLPIRPLLSQDWIDATKEALASVQVAYPIEILASEQCQRYTALHYSGLKVQAAPFWMQRTLALLGQRPINLLVDITNYVMFMTGQPTHAFDAEHVKGGIRVRQAQAGEHLLLLDGQDLALEHGELLIADHEKPIALAGIMGGEHDSILPDTHQIVLEIANFEPVAIRKCSLRHGLRSEASTRFEKGLDIERCDQALYLTHQLLQSFYPALQVEAYGTLQLATSPDTHIQCTYAYLNRRLGREIDLLEVQKLLEPLGFQVSEEDEEALSIQVPTWRATGDVTMPADILEELARMIGYEHFAYQAPSYQIRSAIKQPDKDLQRRLNLYLAREGASQEIYTYPWVSDELIQAAGLDAEEWPSLSAPPAPDQRHIRGSLVPAMLGAVRQNFRYYEGFRLFEQTKVFHQSKTHELTERKALCVAWAQLLRGNKQEAMRVQLFRQLQGLLEAMPRRLQMEALYWDSLAEGRPVWADRSACLGIYKDPERKQRIGVLALLSPQTATRVDLKAEAAVAMLELDVEALQALPSRHNSYEALAQYPEVEQDLSLLVPETVTWAELAEQIRPDVHKLEYLEEYRGQQVPEGYRSISLRYRLRSDEGTLSSEAIDEIRQRLLKRLDKRLGVVLRL